MGVHYPSDCVFGLVQGFLICILGSLLWQAELLGCSSCHNNECYSEYGSDTQLTGQNLRDMSILPFLAVLLCSLLLTIFAVVKPINFWRKCDRSLGLLLPCVAFQVGFLCPNGSFADASLAPPEIPPPWWAYPFAIAVPLFTLLFGHKMKSKYPFISFTVLYVVVSSSLLIWRLFIYPVDETV